MGSPSQPITLLHVDDKPALTDLTAEYLTRADAAITIDTATSASEGLELLETNGYDCIVSDYEMPGQTGIEFLNAVRETYPDLPFVLFTGKGNEEVASEAIAAGVTDYLQKDAGTSQYTVLANRIRNAVERHRATRTADATKEWARTLLEYTSDYVFTVDEHRTISYISPSVNRVLGHSAEALTGESAFDFVHPDDIETATDAFAECLEQPREEVTVEFRAKHADGSYKWMEVRGRNLLNDPVIDGLLINARDITDRKDRETDLRRLKEVYETVFSSVRDAIFLFDVERMESGYEFTLRTVNPAHEAISGFSLEADRGKTPTELIGDADGAAVEDKYRQCVDAREPISYEEVLVMPSGPVSWQTVLTPVLQDDDVVQLVGIAREVPERTDNERALERPETAVGAPNLRR